MVALGVILMIVAFITADVIIRVLMKRMEEEKLKKQRLEALDIGLKLDFANEAKTLKRVEVANPKARILAVDDEEVILSSFRKILVLAGFSIDTVETGQEALTLVKDHGYDFVFTDLKMPAMSGVDVVKGVKHLRPDIDVIVITGYATIETAVETMKFGAMDYVQKPFTEEELIEFVNKTLIRRQDRLDRKIKPKIHLITPSTGETTAKHAFNVPAGIFFSPKHAWVSIQPNGSVRVGVDDFTQKILGSIEDVELPKKGQKVIAGDALFSLKLNSHTVPILSPVSGEVLSINAELKGDIDPLQEKPYDDGWICAIEPSRLSEELTGLKIGVNAISWYQQEVDKYLEIVKKTEDSEKLIGEFSKAFFK